MGDYSAGGYHGRVLEVDLSRGSIESKPLDPETAGNYFGGRGLATRLFCDQVDPACDPLGPDNVIALAVSPLVGTNAPTAGRGHMVFKSPLTQAIGSANSGGSWAVAFKGCGYDALLVKGRAKEPVMLDIREGGVEIVPAGRLWGKNVHETTEQLCAEAGPGEHPRVLCIGPAGENLVRIAAVMNERNRAYGRAGPGAVFGSKKLKAIRVSGRLKTGLKNREQYQSGYDQALYLMRQAPITKRLLKELGTAGLVKLINIIDMLAHKNFLDTTHAAEDLDRMSGEAIRDRILEKAGACHGCPLACQRHTRVGDKKGEGPEFETVVLMGPLCGIYELEAITLANYKCNELGIDTMSFGGTLACAMELFEKGIILKEETAGLELNFGNASVLEKMVEMVAYRRGIGDKLAEGSARLAAFYEHPELSMTVKGLEIPAYDPRASFTQALGYMTSPTGACHLRGGFAVSLAFFGGAKEIPRFSLQQAPVAVRNVQNLGIIQDSLGICRFTGFAFSAEPWARMASGVTGLDFSTVKLEELANRVAALERLFNLAAGLRAEDDTLPDRFSEIPIIVSGKERLIAKSAIEKMRSDYYAVRGWDEKGRPSAELLKSLKVGWKPK
jgi:aldehyde:ferredoxin oxidoreductase